MEDLKLLTNSSLDLWLLLAETRQAMVQARKRDLAPYNISPRQTYLLRVIHDFGNAATLAQISRRVSRRIHSVSAQITTMTDKGLLEKIQNTPGTNLIQIRMTARGLATLDSAINTQTIEKIMAVLSPAEGQQLSLLLNKLLSSSMEASRQQSHE